MNLCICPWLNRKVPSTHSVLAAELVDTAARINNFLLASVKRMPGRAHLDSEIFTVRGTSGEFITATTSYLHFTVVGMDFGFHSQFFPKKAKSFKKGA